MNEMHDQFLPTRESLLVRLKSWDDQEGWSDFFNAYWRLIYGAALRSGLNDAQAQDVVQDTVITVAKKMKDFRYKSGVDSFKGWLLYLTRKRIALEYRRKDRDRLAGPSKTGEEWIVEAEALPDPAGFDLESLWEHVELTFQDQEQLVGIVMLLSTDGSDAIFGEARKCAQQILLGLPGTGMRATFLAAEPVRMLGPLG